MAKASRDSPRTSSPAFSFSSAWCDACNAQRWTGREHAAQCRALSVALCLADRLCLLRVPDYGHATMEDREVQGLPYTLTAAVAV